MSLIITAFPGFVNIHPEKILRFKVLFLLNFLPSAPAGTETEGQVGRFPQKNAKKFAITPLQTASALLYSH